MTNLKDILSRHRRILVISIAVAAIASYMIPLSSSFSADASSKYGTNFPGKGKGVSGQPGNPGQGGNFPGNGDFPGKGGGNSGGSTTFKSKSVSGG
jgi:hypothetical protein